MNKHLTLQHLPPEIIYNILSFLPSCDITTIASFYCRVLRNWTLVLLDERAQQSMLLGWRLMLGATTIKPATDQGDDEYEEDKEYVCEYKTIDPWTRNIYFTVRAFGKDGFCSLVDDTAFSPLPPEPHQGIQIPFGLTLTRVQVSVLKEKVPTKLLEFATTLPDEYSFTVQADDYQHLEPDCGLDVAATIHPEFTIHYHIHRSSDSPTTPPSLSPGISLHIKSLQLNPYWWWTQLDRHHYASFIGLEHRFW
ncbi:hypothetical protein BC941DRAFT_424045 [Chlamydoabsidia padenii]|nr:hypothetical protein BC941DRAFT_424045 [Chlamydoabsidia padenii]